MSNVYSLNSHVTDPGRAQSGDPFPMSFGGLYPAASTLCTFVKSAHPQDYATATVRGSAFCYYRLVLTGNSADRADMDMTYGTSVTAVLLAVPESEATQIAASLAAPAYLVLTVDNPTQVGSPLGSGDACDIKVSWQGNTIRVLASSADPLRCTS